LSRAHELFAGRTRSVTVDARLAPYDGLLERAAALTADPALHTERTLAAA